MAIRRRTKLLMPSMAVALLLRTSCLTAFVTPLPFSCRSSLALSHERHPFLHHVAPAKKDDEEEKSKEEQDGDEVFFDDFDFVVGGSSSTASPSSSEQGAAQEKLQERIREYQQEEIRKDAQLAKNWRTGNWKVRGFCLDKTDPLANDGSDETVQKILVTDIAMDPSSPDLIAVARTDGTVCLVRLGTEYLTKFTAKLTASEDENDTVKVTSQLVRQEDAKADDAAGDVSSEETPFEVIHQFSAHQNQITALLMEDDMIFTAGQGSFEIMVWGLPDEEGDKMIPLRSLSNAHGGTVVAMKTLSMNRDQDEHNLLLSAAVDGSFALWDIKTGDLVFRCQLSDDNDDTHITCADVNENVLYIGLSSGHVVGYFVDDLIKSASVGDESCPIPSCRFLAHDSGVSAILCTGDGTLARSSPGTKSSILFTGGSDGGVKQWEILSRKIESNEEGQPSTKLEHWPRLSNQRMQRRAHMFRGHSEGPITALASIDSTKFLSAGVDGTVRAWSPSKGTELFRMDGFVGGVTSLCLDHDMLVTNGMDEFVCVHDFDVDESEVEDGYELEW